MKIIKKLKELASFIPNSCMQVYKIESISPIINCRRVSKNIQAVKFNGTLNSIYYFIPNNLIDYREFDRVNDQFFPPTVVLKTPKGNMVLQVDDYLIKNERGEYYGCEKSFFNENFEEI